MDRRLLTVVMPTVQDISSYLSRRPKRYGGPLGLGLDKRSVRGRVRAALCIHPPICLIIALQPSAADAQATIPAPCCALLARSAVLPCI